jgi:hypothetical protein
MTGPDRCATGVDDARHRQGFPPRFTEMLAPEGLAGEGGLDDMAESGIHRAAP